MQVGIFGLDGAGEQMGDAERVELAQRLVFDVDGAIGALGERFANGLRGTRGSGAERHDLAAVLFLQLQGFFEGIGIGLVDFEAQVVFLDPMPAGVDSQLGVAHGNLLDSDDDFHR